MEIMSPCLAHSRCCFMAFVIIAFLSLLALLLLALISFPILPDSIRASGYPRVVLACCKKKSLKNGIDFIPIFPRNISLNTILLALSWDKVEKTLLPTELPDNLTMCLLGLLQKGGCKAFRQADTRAVWPRRSEVRECLPLTLVISFGIPIIFLRLEEGRDGYFYPQWFLKVMWFQNLLFLQYYSILPTLQAKRCIVHSVSLTHLCWIQAIALKTDFWTSGTPTKLPILYEFFFKKWSQKD